MLAFVVILLLGAVFLAPRFNVLVAGVCIVFAIAAQILAAADAFTIIDRLNDLTMALAIYVVGGALVMTISRVGHAMRSARA